MLHIPIQSETIVFYYSLKNMVHVKLSQEERTSPLQQLFQELSLSSLHFSVFPSLFFLFDFYNFLLVGAAALTQTKLHFLVIGPHGM